MLKFKSSPIILNDEMDNDRAVRNDDIELALSDNELLALGLPINKSTTPTVENAAALCNGTLPKPLSILKSTPA